VNYEKPHSAYQSQRPINPDAMKTNEPKKPATGESPVRLAADTKASVEPEALSRLVGEGGSEGPMSVMERIDSAFKNGLWGKIARKGASNKIKRKQGHEP
jgi:hypothetical protein